MAMPLVISSSSNNQKQLGFTISTKNHRNKGLSLFPSFINGGGEPAMNNGASSNYSNQQKLGSAVATNNHKNKCISLVPSFNGGDKQVMNGVSFNYSNHRNRSLSLVPSFNDCEPAMNNGISSNYSNQQKLDFYVSSNNHRNRSLSLLPSLDIGGEPVTMIEKRRSFVRNYHCSYSARPVATREILRARLLYALSTRCRMFTNQEEAFSTRSGPSFSSQIHSQINLTISEQRRARLTITELDGEVCAHNSKAKCNHNEALAPIPVSVYYPPKTNNDNNEYDIENSDGVTHSLPCKKYGPYTCPRCFGEFSTSQTFAAHVSSHYKYETKAQRRRRLMAKIRRRNLRLHPSREGLTLIPTKAFARREQGPMNMAEAEANGDGVLSIVQIKEEPADF